MDADRAKELAAKAQLDFGDWLEITGVDIGEHGMYSVASDGIRFRPNKIRASPDGAKGKKKMLSVWHHPVRNTRRSSNLNRKTPAS